MAQKNYLAVVRPAKDKLDPTDALLLADLQEGGHTIENDLAEIIRGGKNGEQLRVWLYERNKRDDGKYHGVFAYTVPESYEMSFDDEDNKIELTLKVKWNSAEGTEPNLPPEWFEAAGAPTVEYESFAEKVGSFEDQTKAKTASS